MSQQIVPQSNTPAQRIGADLHAAGLPAQFCGDLEEIRGWLQDANGKWYACWLAKEADHPALVEQVQAAVTEAQRS